MNITYYSKYSSRGPSSRFRAYQFQDLFQASGIRFTISELFDDEYFEILAAKGPLRNLKKIPYSLRRFAKRKRVLRNDTSDLRIIEQQLFPYLPYRIEKEYLPARYLLEFDDAIYLTHPQKLPSLIRGAQSVIAGNETLADYSRQFNSNVHVIPNVLNTDLIQPRLKKSTGRLKIGWSGIEYNLPFLNLLADVLRRVVSKHSVEVTILSGSRPRHLDFPFRYVQWDPAREPDQINEFDIGLMPLKLDEWCKGKCGFKLLQYMSLEIPSIATPIGVNEQIVRHGVNGFLAKELSEWEACLTQLVMDATLRERMGKAARATVIERYSTDVWFPRLVELYRANI